MDLPKDPVMLLSFVNTKLRDDYESLDELAASLGADKEAIEEKLQGIGYSYDKDKNRFT